VPVLSFTIALQKAELPQPRFGRPLLTLGGIVHAFEVDELPDVADPWVVVEVEHEPAHTGRAFDVRLTMQDPGGAEYELVAGTITAPGAPHADVPPVSILAWRPYFALSQAGALSFRVYLDGALAFTRAYAVIVAAPPHT